MYLGIDVGGTKTLLAVLNDSGVIQESIKFPTPKEYGQFLNDLASNVAKLSTNKFLAAGVGLPGRLNHRKGTVIALGNLPWRDAPVSRDIKRILRCPTVLHNDAKLGALSEAMLLKDKYNRVLYVTIGTGIGTGFIVNQHIEKNMEDSEAGQILMERDGKLHKWEELASGKAIVRRFGMKASQITDQTTWHIIAHDIAQGLADLVAVLMPEVIVMGGGVNEYFNKYSTQLKLELKKYETPLIPMPPVQRASRPDEAVIYGCYDLAKEVYGH